MNAKRLFALSLFVTLKLSADTLSFHFYNDWFAGTDQHFTNAVGVSWLEDAKKEEGSFSSFVKGLLPKMTLLDSPFTAAGANLTQFMYTPANTQPTTPQYNDIPYAGHLSLDTFLFFYDTKSFKELRLSLGATGKASGAKWAQDNFHLLIGNQEAKGWDTQIASHATLNATVRYGEISWEKSLSRNYRLDWFNHIGGEFGNYKISAFGGSYFRIGRNYPRSFNLHYPYMQEEASLLPLQKEPKNFAWELSCGISAEALGYFYILDEAKNEGYHLQQRDIQYSLYFGTTLYYNKIHRFNFFYQSHSPYTSQNNHFESFGGINYTILLHID